MNIWINYAEHEPATFFDIVNPLDIQLLTAPLQTLKALSGLVILDEFQSIIDR